MGSFGDKLKREREMRGVTLEEISESTKIARRHLEALESEDFAALPGGVFNKGFVRAYARFIGISEDQTVADYSAVHKEETPPEDQFPLEIHQKPDRQMNPRSSQLPLIGAVVALVLVVAGYAAWRSKHHPAESVVPSASAASRGEASDSKIPAEQASAQPAPSESSTTAKMVAVDQKVSAPEPPRKPAASTAPLRSNAQPERNARPLAPDHSFFVIIKAKEDAWISVVADGRRVSHGILRADRQKFVRAGKQIIVTTGNAGGIDVSFNGKPLGAIGNESEARTLLFTPTGASQQ
jgi:cytoskeleton protein RodZ